MIQAAAAVAQVGLAFVLWRATSRYVRITSDQLTELRDQRDSANQRDAAAAQAAITRIITAIHGFPPSLSEGYAKNDLEGVPRWRDRDVEMAINISDRLAPVPLGIELSEHLDTLSRLINAYTLGDPRAVTGHADRREWQERIRQALRALAAMDDALRPLCGLSIRTIPTR